MRKNIRWIIPLLALLVFVGCAQVPRETVELSNTVGRDLTQVHQAHRELAVLLFDRMEGDINQFVNEVYAPYQVRKLLEADFDDFKSGNPESLFAALDLAMKSPRDTEAQLSAVDAMDIFVQVVHEEVEAYRAELLRPVKEQREETLAKIESSYLQIHYANSIVTGHLGSVVKVHDAQEELLNQFGVEDLREEVGHKLVAASEKISRLTEKASSVEDSLDKNQEKIEKVATEIKNLWN